MGIFTGLFKSRDKPQNSYDSPSYAYFFGRANSGKRVTDRTALQHIIVYACVRVLSEAIAQLPLHVYKYTDNGKERVTKHPLYFLLHDQPNPEMTSFIFREYLDFVSGIGVFALGYNNRKYNDALKAQIDKLLHTSNYYYNEPIIDAAKAVTKASGLDRVFFTNSGAEALEGCIKTARKYAFLKDGSTNHEIIALEHSFHGRTMGALSITGKKIYRDAFEPDIGNIKFAELNNIDSVKKQITDKTCAIIFETVQGEGGVYPATEVFLKEIIKICDENDILMILDEVQCGMGRTGYMFAYQKFGIMPDVVATAKALGCGVLVGAFLMKEKVAQNSLKAGDHGSTYGGNPFVGTAVKTVLELYEELDICSHVNEVGNYLYEQLECVKNDYDCIIEHRGIGLMQGLVFNEPVSKYINSALENGMLIINAGNDIIRFLPPLIVEKRDIDEMICILRKSIEAI